MNEEIDTSNVQSHRSVTLIKNTSQGRSGLLNQFRALIAVSTPTYTRTRYGHWRTARFATAERTRHDRTRPDQNALYTHTPKSWMAASFSRSLLHETK